MKAFLQINSKINIVHFLKASCWNVLFTKGPALFSNLGLRDGPPGVGHVLCAHRQIVGHPPPPWSARVPPRHCPGHTSRLKLQRLKQDFRLRL